MTQSTEVATEEWRSVVGYEGWYEVSDLGRVRRVVGGQGAVAGRVLTHKPDKSGYPTVPLTVGNRKKEKKVHILVAEAFIGPRPTPGHQVNHIDGRKDNPKPMNLEYLTRQENMRHAEKMGLINYSHPGEEAGLAKLTDHDVGVIRFLYGKARTKNIAALFDIDYCTAWRIGTRRAWKHLP